MPQLQAATLTVFAAASLSDALQEIGTSYEKVSGQKVSLNFGASSFLARQIEKGAPADLFLSADEAKMDELERKGMIVTNTRRSLLSNSLVIVATAEARAALKKPQDLTSASVKRVALAEPGTVPAGIYARSYLDKLNLWPLVERKIVPTENVRGALSAVEAGNADAAIVFKTDARISKRVFVVCEIPIAEGPRIAYPIAVLKDSKQTRQAKDFSAYLQSGPATRVFQRFGFIVNEPAKTRSEDR